MGRDRPTRAQLASRLRWLTTTDRGIPPAWKLERVLGYSRRDFIAAWGSWQEALAGIQPHASAEAAEVGTLAERSRHRCPHGHPFWAPRDGYFVCRACERDSSIGAERFERLIERASGEAIHFEEFVALR